MAMPGKLVGGVHPAAVRNKAAPLGGDWTQLFPATETSGATLANLGVGNTYGSGNALWTDGALSGSPDFLTDADGSPYIRLGANGAANAALAILHTAGGSDISLPRGLLLLHFGRPAGDLISVETVLNSGVNPGTTAGGFTVQRLADSTLRATLHDGTSPRSLDFPDVDFSVPHVLLVGWGVPDFFAYLDTPANYLHYATTAGWKIAATKVLRINAGFGGTVSAGGVDLRVIGFSAAPPETLDIAELLADPSLILRPTPPLTTGFSLRAGPICGRPRATEAVVRFQSGTGDAGGELASADVAVKLEYGPGMQALNTFTDPVKVSAITAVRQPLDVTLPVSAGIQTCYRPWYTLDGTNWYPFPGGHYFVWGKRASTGGAAGAFADPHIYAYAPDWVTQGLGVEQFGTGALGSAAESRYAIWRCMHDYWHLLAGSTGEPEFTLIAGDVLFTPAHDDMSGTDDFSDALYDKAALALDFMFLLWKKAAALLVVGNWEFTAGYFQNAHAGSPLAAQKQADGVLLRLFPNPGPTTYPEGGENEGEPTVSNALSWVPPLGSLDANGDPYDAAYRNTYVIPAVARGPRRNFYAFTWGGLLLAMLDTYRYSKPGDPAAAIGAGGYANRDAYDWALGDHQWAWLDRVRAQTAATWALAVLHGNLGGQVLPAGELYGRGSGDELGHNSTEEARLAAALEASGFEGLLESHDHEACILHNAAYDLDVLHLPSATLRIGGFEASYGALQWGGLDINAKGDGLGTAKGILATLGTRGYGYLIWTADALTYKVRHAALSYDSTSVVITPERYLGEKLTCASLAVTLSEKPRDVGLAVLETDVDEEADFWTTPPTDHKSASPPGYAGSEFHASATIALAAGTPDGDVRVLAVPHWAAERSVPTKARIDALSGTVGAGSGRRPLRRLFEPARHLRVDGGLRIP